MQTMRALLRVNGSRDMTVPVSGVTPGEAWLLMHIHDPDTKDVFEDAHVTDDVERTKLDERTRLQGKYHASDKLILQLFPGRTAADIPGAFDELEGVPLELSMEGRRARALAEDRAAVEVMNEEGDVEFAGLPPVAPPAPAPATPAAPAAAPATRAAPAPAAKTKPKTRQLTPEQSRKLFGGKTTAAAKRR